MNEENSHIPWWHDRCTDIRVGVHIPLKIQNQTQKYTHNDQRKKAHIQINDHIILRQYYLHTCRRMDTYGMSICKYVYTHIDVHYMYCTYILQYFCNIW